jgi:hypothetical protein
MALRCLPPSLKYPNSSLALVKHRYIPVLFAGHCQRQSSLWLVIWSGNFPTLLAKLFALAPKDRTTVTISYVTNDDSSLLVLKYIYFVINDELNYTLADEKDRWGVELHPPEGLRFVTK